MRAFLAELKRRHVYRIGVIYLITAWLLTQVIVTVETPLGLPGWADSLVITLLIIGFPIALVLSWAFDLSSHGITPTIAKPVHANPRGTPMTRLFGRILNRHLVALSLVTGCCVLNCPHVAADDAPLVQQVADRLAIEQVAFRYITALDTRDADLYLSVFTEDAEYDIEGQIYRGHEALRGIILGLQRAREAAAAEGRPVMDLYHTNLNPVVELISDNEAHFAAYWQTLRKAEDNTMRIGGMGHIEDVLVKVDGEWKIKKRVLTNFIQRLERSE